MPRSEKPQSPRDSHESAHVEQHFRNGKLHAEGEVSPVKRVRRGEWTFYADDGETPSIVKKYSKAGRRCMVTMLRCDGTMYGQYEEVDNTQAGYAWHFHLDGETICQVGNYIDTEQNGTKLSFDAEGYLLGNDENDDLKGVEYIVDGERNNYLSGYLYAGLVRMQFDENLHLMEMVPQKRVRAQLDYVEREVAYWQKLGEPK